jgi:hypothetical protein
MPKLRWLVAVFPTQWLEFNVSSCRNCDEQSGTGAGFLEELWSFLIIFIPPTAPYSLIILS